MSASLQGGPPPDPVPQQDIQALEELRDILLRGDQAYSSASAESVLDGAMDRKIDESKNEMETILAPVRVRPSTSRSAKPKTTSSMRALAHRVDQNLRSAPGPGRLSRRLQAGIRGAPESELLLRDSLPSNVQEVLLMHHDSGPLLEHLSRETEAAEDRDLANSLSTAIRSSTEDSLGAEREGGLDSTRDGDVSVLLGPAHCAYLAAAIRGYEPEGFCHVMRAVPGDVSSVEHGPILKDSDGGASSLDGVDAIPRPLMPAGGEEAEDVDERLITGEELPTTGVSCRADPFLTSAGTGEQVEAKLQQLGFLVVGG